MSFDSILAPLTAELRDEIIAMDALLKSLRVLKFKRTVDKRKISYASPDFGVSYAILPLEADLKQHFGWYYIHDKVAKKWYRKADYFIETLSEIAKTDAQAAEHIFNAINECTACKGEPCSAIPYTYEGKQKAACYGRIIMSLCREDFGYARAFFQMLNALTEQKA